MERKRWYKDKVFYQIWPRSFKDGNGEIGVIASVTEARVSFSAASKSSIVTVSLSSDLFSAARPARRVKSSRSAPVKRSDFSASTARSTSFASGILLVWISRMRRRWRSSSCAER